jgi:tripartite-type tricarboxylate transporter receptor subunit TctC
MRKRAISSWAVLAGLTFCGGANAQTPEEFYRNKTVSVVIGYPPGGIFDTASRLLIRHMPKHIPGHPNLVPKNMPGAASLIAANHLYNVATKDGTEFGLMGGTVPFGALWNRDGIKFDATKFNWIGSIQSWDGVVLVRRDASAKSYEEAKVVPVNVGATGSGDVTAIYPAVLNALTGTKFNVVGGYQGSADLNLAIDRNEVAGRLGWCWDCVKLEKPGWFSDNLVRPLAQLTFRKHPDLKDLPNLGDLAMNEEDLQIMRFVFGGQLMAVPFTLPPGTPADRVQALRDAFAKTMNDTEFRADARASNVVVDPTGWQDMEQLIRSAYATPPAVVERAAKIIMGVK